MEIIHALCGRAGQLIITATNKNKAMPMTLTKKLYLLIRSLHQLLVVPAPKTNNNNIVKK